MYRSRIKRTILFLLVLSMSLIIGEGLVDAQSQDRPEYLPDEVLVKFKEGVAQDVVDTVVAQAGGKIIKRFRLIPVLQIKVSIDSVQSVVKFFRSLPDVEYAEPNYLRYLNATPNDSRYPEMWGLNNTGQTGGTVDADIDAPEAWDIATGNSTMVVADIDTGLDLGHIDFAGNIYTNPGEIPGNGIDDDANGYIDDVNGWDFARDDNNPNEEAICGGHGTHTAGTIGARGNNGIGVTGVNWNVKIMPLKIFKVYFVILCSASSADIISAIDYAAMMGVRVSNNSYGGGPYSQAEYDAIRASKSIFVAAAGNENINTDITPNYPSAYNLSNIIAVAATDHNDNRAWFSNYGTTTVDLAAPGVSILSTTPNDTYSLFDGTSMATPHVTGAVALLMGYDPNLTNNEVRWRILKGVDHKGLPVATGGRLNIYNSLTLPPPQVTVDVTPNGPTTIPGGGTISYHIVFHNNSQYNATVNVSVVAVLPNGSEIVLNRGTVTILGNGSFSRDFSRSLPFNIAPGEYQIVGRAEIASTSYDESIVVYTITP